MVRAPAPAARRLPGTDIGDILGWLGCHFGFKTGGARKAFLTARIKEFLQGHRLDPEQLLTGLESGGPLLRRLCEVITITETSFFRNPPQMEMFASEILPGLLEDRRSTGSFRIRIWSAGASIGAEPYSLGMLLL